MKAITCSQCGALIKRIRERDRFAVCEYCRAKIPIQKEKVIIVPDKPEKPKLRELSEKEKANVFESVELDDEVVFGFTDEAKAVGFITLAVFLIAVPIVLYNLLSPEAEVSETKKPKKISEIKTPTPTPEPCPNIYIYSFNLYFEDDTHFIKNPKLENSQLPTCDPTELRKGIFSDRNTTVKVKITVNKEGEVTDAKQISGDKFFKESAEQAALKSLFIKQKRQTAKIITYYYSMSSKG